MFYGKRDDIEARGLTGTFYSVWLNAEDIHGSFYELDGLESDVIGNAYDDLDEAIGTVVDEFQEGGLFPEWAQAHAAGAELEFIEALIEQNDLRDGIDLNGDLPVYELFFYPATGQWSENCR